ncbi:hypothetical protein NE865_15503 [Phthorimaea operculella]|nr:hypothetical protein NE865_15503 [Phthorimaea operculella]
MVHERRVLKKQWIERFIDCLNGTLAPGDTMAAVPDTIRAMQGTAQPWLGWTGWRKRDRYQRRRTRIRLQELTDVNDLAWRLSHPSQGQPDLSHGGGYYTPEQIRNFIRWGASFKLNYPYPPIITLPPNWPKGYQEALKIWPAENVPLKPVTRVTSPHIRHEATGWWEGAGRGLPLGAALLAAILLLLRAADRCLHTNLFKLPMRRRQSEEWPTPNVMATSLAARMTNDYTTTRPQSPSEHYTERVVVDLPPPYSECLADGTSTDTRQKPENEEPPPPYSACYVAYSNPKDGQPSVHFFTNQCQNLFANYEAGPSNVHDTGQTEVDLQDSDSDARSDRAYHSDTMEDREDEVEIVNNETTVQDVGDSEVQIEETTSTARDRYVVV